MRGGVRSLIQFTHQSTEFGGPTFDPESGEQNGGVLVLEAESVVAVRAIIEEDPYWKGGVVRVVLTAHNDLAYLRCCSLRCSGIKKRPRSRGPTLPLSALCSRKPEIFIVGSAVVNVLVANRLSLGS